MFKRTFTVLLGSLAAGALLAQEAEEDYTVVLPEAAQKCVLPTAPDAVPPDADYDSLVAAKGQVGEFQNHLPLSGGFAGTKSDSPSCDSKNTRSLAGSVLLAFLDTTWGFLGDSYQLWPLV